MSSLRVSDRTDEMLNQMASRSGRAKIALVEEAVEDLRRKLFFDGLEDDYAALKSDAKAWEAEQAEREIWDAASADGLDD